jgi:alkanesulfonate monooxygenase SsuD/methylene tetrahydromethanopterin reductase-like flavin-dependent oxidoreductase (luciferase family)
MSISTAHPSRADRTVQRDAAPALSGPNRMKLGVFGANLSGGSAGPSFSDEFIQLDNWAEILDLAVAADRAGFEAYIPISRWRGFEGPSEYWDRSYETFTWGAAIAQATERIQILTTCAVATIHPVMAAKMGATLDHIAGGRWGLNIVPGWHGPEFEMFGIELGQRSQRYRHAQEWMDLLDKLWSSDEVFDFDGEFFQVKGALSEPKPMQSPRPLVMNAGQSTEGREFAVRNADMIYINLADVDNIAPNVADVRRRSEEAGKRTAVWGILHVLCRDTEAEAEKALATYLEQGDYETAERYMNVVSGGDAGTHDKFRDDLKAGRDLLVRSGGNHAVAGTPEQVVEKIAELSEAGVDGLGLIWNNYAEGIQQYTEVLEPLLRDAGLRA